MSKKPTNEWRIIRIKGSPAADVAIDFHTGTTGFEVTAFTRLIHSRPLLPP